MAQPIVLLMTDTAIMDTTEFIKITLYPVASFRLIRSHENCLLLVHSDLVSPFLIQRGNVDIFFIN